MFALIVAAAGAFVYFLVFVRFVVIEWQGNAIKRHSFFRVCVLLATIVAVQRDKHRSRFLSLILTHVLRACYFSACFASADPVEATATPLLGTMQPHTVSYINI